MSEYKHYSDIIYGEAVMFQDLDPRDYMNAFQALNNGVFIGQERFHMPDIDMVGGVQLTAKEVQLTPEQEFCLRPSSQKSREVYTNVPTDAEKLTLVRHQLRRERDRI